MKKINSKIEQLFLVYFLFLFIATTSAQTGCWEHVYVHDYFSGIGIKTDGTMWAWGENNWCQLGNGNSINQFSPVQIGNDSDWKEATVGSYYGHAIKNNGTLWAWGYNGGYFGNGATNSSCEPIQIGTDNDWKHVKQGDSNCDIAMKNDGTLWGWGSNASGVLGNDNILISNIPIQIGNSNDWRAFDVGFVHVIALKNDGSLWAWGKNDQGQLGDGTNVRKNHPVQIGTDNDWREVSANRFNSNAIKNDNSLYLWGQNYQPYPFLLPVGGQNWKHVRVSYGFDAENFGIKNDGTLWTFSPNPFSQFNISQIGTENYWEEINTATGYRIGLTINHDLLSWGGNNYGQLGLGTTSSISIPTPISCNTLGNLSFDTKKDVAIFPNPTQDSFFIVTEKRQIEKLELTDVVGKLMILENELKNNTKLDISNLKKGTYFLKLTFENDIQTYKVLKN
jgi:alpha-tubulin suppressor-like RCC1 family protein